MYRNAIEELKLWKDREGRMPLLLVGARQVGKTWLLKEFGRKFYKNVAYVSFDVNPAMSNLFSGTVSPKEIIPVLRAETGAAIKPDETLIIFDEVQESPRALLSMKYFCEEAPEYHVAAAGSTLGVMLHQQNSFPVGKVEFMDVHPMCFDEFLKAVGEGQLALFMKENAPDKYTPFHERLIRVLKEYFYVGGMPAAINAYSKNRGDYPAVRKAQEEILRAYERDFSKYATPLFAERLRLLWHSAPAQLSKENKKFMYSSIKNGARAREFEVAAQWLKDSSMIASVNRVSKPMHPLKTYEEAGAFKLFLNDVGLLSALVDLAPKMVAGSHDIFVEFKGALAEQFVFQELRHSIRKNIYYWSKKNGEAEIDFLIQNEDGMPVAIEVKSGINLRSKSLKAYMEAFRPAYSIRTSLADFKLDRENMVLDMPLYAVSKIAGYLRLDSLDQI
jgi:predicted AAA+ superfamily ATPase